MNNGVPVHVHIQNEIQQGTEKDTIEFWTTGVYSKKNEAIFISYELKLRILKSANKP
ncbi:DUF1934 domain-containing protein [Bacillus sp. FJAT-47783]|uniref:DUF1934 domain-containing protein n=1 Tax=Bacillus sp. FJAT-47783 TaxID=2922712 RepID=UPI001FAC3F87|nr:DUF1934 domain-containing protein [Bacillus sp. FJAT-47783]